MGAGSAPPPCNNRRAADTPVRWAYWEKSWCGPGPSRTLQSMTPPSDTQRTSVQGSTHLRLTGGAGSSWGVRRHAFILPSKPALSRQDLPEAQMSCNQHPGRFQRRSARRRPEFCRACGPAAAAPTRTGPGGCAGRRRRCPGCKDDRAPRVCESYAIKLQPWEKAGGSKRARTCGPGVSEPQVIGVLRDAVHVAEAVEAEVCPDAAGTCRGPQASGPGVLPGEGQEHYKPLAWTSTNPWNVSVHGGPVWAAACCPTKRREQR